jgi:hypothetical protein
VVDQILSVDGHQLHDVSADELILEVYRRAEAQAAGQGERLLAYLYRNGEAEFGAMRTDPAFESVRAIAAQLAPDFDPRTFRFATAQSAAAVPVSNALAGAIGQLAYVYAQPNLSQLRGLAVRHFRKPGFSFERALVESTSTRDAIVRMFEQGTPPPRPEAAAESILRETLEFNGALKAEQGFLDSIEALRSELGLERLDAELRAYAAREDEIPSRRKQAEQAESASLLGKVSRPDAASVVGAVQRARAKAEGPSPARQQSAQQYSDYVAVSFEPPPDAAAPPPAGGGGGGGGGGLGIPGNGERSRRPARDASTAYRTRLPSGTYSARASGNVPVAPTYRVAIRSARAGRGVSVGATIADSLEARPVSAAWVVNREDGRFGKLVVRMVPTKGGEPFLTASRTLFEDSFYAAASLSAGGHFGTTAFREGDILVAMSMDPFAAVPEGEALEREMQQLASKAEELAEGDFGGRMRLMLEAMSLRERAASIPRRVVVHPALFGRELAWSAVRADFWLNDRQGLSQEAELTNGGQPMPSELAAIDLTDAGTWQFFERASEVVLSSDGRVRSLTVRSSGPGDFPVSDRSHFALSMFRPSEAEDGLEEDEARRLPELEVQLQPMLDWLATNHHDFIRLNDFSESLSLLRWLKKRDVVPLLLDMDGESPAIATPDQVVIGDGPRLARPR